MEPKPSLWLAIAKDGRVKYTTDSCRASDWKKSGSYRLVRDYYTAPVHASDISEKRVHKLDKYEPDPVAWHEPGAYGNVTTHKDWALANGWEPLYKERT